MADYGALLRRQVEQFLTESVDIQRQSTARDAYGQIVHTWTTSSLVKGRLLPIKRSDGGGQVAGAEQGRVQWRLVVRWDSDLRDGDRVVIGGTLYEVSQVDKRRTDRVDIQALVVEFG